MTSSSPLRTEMEKGFLSLEMKTVKSYLELSIVAIAIVNQSWTLAIILGGGATGFKILNITGPSHPRHHDPNILT